jgi:hydroxyquinol 1,2-dioxygenase
LLPAPGGHPGRPANNPDRGRAPAPRPVTTHIFDRESEHIDGDAVFAVKPSLLRELTAHRADDPQRPPGLAGVPGPWWSLVSDFALAPAD